MVGLECKSRHSSETGQHTLRNFPCISVKRKRHDSAGKILVLVVMVGTLDSDDLPAVLGQDAFGFSKTHNGQYLSL